MNKIFLKSMVIGLIAISLNAMSLNAISAPLSQSEITHLFSAKTAACIKSKDQSSCKTYMGDDGRVKRFTENTGKTRLGTWHASADNRLCIRWENKTKDLCFDINKNEDNTYNLDRKGKTKSVITGFVAGDTLK